MSYKKIFTLEKKYQHIYLLVSCIFFIFSIVHEGAYSKSLTQIRLENNKKNTLALKMENGSYLFIRLLQDSDPEYIKMFKKIIKSGYYNQGNCFFDKVQKQFFTTLSCNKKIDEPYYNIAPSMNPAAKYTNKIGVVSILKRNNDMRLVFTLQEDASYLDENKNLVIVGYVVKGLENLQSLNTKSKTKILYLNFIENIKNEKHNRNKD